MNSARASGFELKSVASELGVLCLCNASVRVPSNRMGRACKGKGEPGASLLVHVLSPLFYSAKMLQRNSMQSSPLRLLIWRSQSNKQRKIIIFC